ncbi:hypothetical protein F4604DRAFT_1259516 [Suillus subluteus]|nr:hypothetical protein F4604DRAFT_1259516 [Suillus subluteus]
MDSHHTLSAQIALPLPPRGVNNVFIVLVTVVVYDFVTNLGDELDYLLGSRMTLAKGLFLGCRYTPFVICAIHARTSLSPSAEGCPGLAESSILLLGIVLLCAECVFVLPTYALWNCDRRVRIALLVSYLGFFCGMIILVVASGLHSNIANFAPGCYTDASVSADFILAPYIFLLLLEIEIVGLTLYRMIRHYRATRSRTFNIAGTIQRRLYPCWAM